MQYHVTVKIVIEADSQGEALATIEKRVRAAGTSEAILARVAETISIKESR